MVTLVGKQNEASQLFLDPPDPRYTLRAFDTIEVRPRQNELSLYDYLPDAVALYLEHSWREIDQRQIRPLLSTQLPNLPNKFSAIFSDFAHSWVSVSSVLSVALAHEPTRALRLRAQARQALDELVRGRGTARLGADATAGLLASLDRIQLLDTAAEKAAGSKRREDDSDLAKWLIAWSLCVVAVISYLSAGKPTRGKQVAIKLSEWASSFSESAQHAAGAAGILRIKETRAGRQLRQLMGQDQDLVEATRVGADQIARGKSKRWADVKRRIGRV